MSGPGWTQWTGRLLWQAEEGHSASTDEHLPIRTSLDLEETDTRRDQWKYRMGSVLPRERAFAPREAKGTASRPAYYALIDRYPVQENAKCPSQMSHCLALFIITTQIVIIPLLCGRNDIFISLSPTPSMAGYTWCWRRLHEGQLLGSGLLGSCQIPTWHIYQAIRTFGQSSHEQKEPRRCSRVG